MDSVLQAQFQRVETALATLIDSITALNPSPQAALDLVTADSELSKGLEQLAVHQQNHTRILSLREEAERLEAQVKSDLRTLAELRRELLQTPTISLPEDSRPVPFDELLRFAKNISQHTVPPTYREPIPKDDVESPVTGEVQPTTSPNGVTPASAAPESTEEKKYDHPLTTQQSQWLQELQQSGDQWVPWPNHDKIRMGNLMAIQHMLDQGKDPSVVLRPEEQEEQDRRRAEEERERKEREEREQREEEAERERRRATYAAGQRQSVQQPAVFGGLDMYDPDEE